jgi:hypothetical protein
MIRNLSFSPATQFENHGATSAEAANVPEERHYRVIDELF